ncbi:uncharacterized protein LOC142814429 [Rhipicephalus microplus]|uniref:uncharacterized protein LOC142814429 n=1 Tax=Rhipicephalus microplus TaxID=6941 RepID=UPI003F6C638A
MQLSRFQQQPDLLAHYDDTIKAYFNDYHAEQVPDKDLAPKPNTYMPHHGVIRRDAVTTKLQVIFDAQSQAPDQPSLNNVLMKGPNMDADLLKLLLKFKMHPIIMIVDIKKAYLQISIRPDDKDALCSLWVDHLPTKHDPFHQLFTGESPACPSAQNRALFCSQQRCITISNALKSDSPKQLECLRQSFYVDNLVVGPDNLQTAQQIYSEAKTILADARMEIRKWASSSSLLGEQFRTDPLSLENDGGDPHTMKVLGLLWERNDDSVIVSTDNVLKLLSTMPTTKRKTLQAFASLYDPLLSYAIHSSS